MRFDFEDFAMGCIGLFLAVLVGGVVLIGGGALAMSFYSYVISSEDKVCTVQEKQNLWSGDDTVMTVTTDCGPMSIEGHNASIYSYLEEGETYKMHVTGPPIREVTIMWVDNV